MNSEISSLKLDKEINPHDIIVSNGNNNDNAILLSLMMNRNPEVSKNITNIETYLSFSKEMNKIMNDYSMNKTNFQMDINANVNRIEGTNESDKSTNNLTFQNYQIDMNNSKFYYSAPSSNYSYLSNPNQLRRKSTLLLYNKYYDTKLSNLFNRIFNKTSVREFSLGSSNNISFKTVGFNSEYNLIANLPINLELKIFKGKKKDYYSDEFGVSTTDRYGFSLIKNFNDKSFFFRDYPYLDPSHYLEFYFSKNRYSNSISQNSFGYSRKYEDIVPAKSEFVSYGLRFKKDLMFFKELDYKQNNSLGDRVLNMSGEVEFKKYNDDTNTISTNLFLRKFFFWKYFTLQSAVENKLIFSNKNLKNHQLSYVNDFKGIDRFDKGIYDTSDTTSVRVNKGVNAYVKFYNKLYFDVNKFFFGYLEEKYPYPERNYSKNSKNSLFGYNPLFSESKFVFLPYLHLNFLYQEKSEKSLELKSLNLDKNDLYISGGVGLSFLSEYFAFEVFYSPVIKKKQMDVESKFGFNFGID